MEFETIIGFEVHCELSTDTKVFCGCSTRFGQAPNTQTCPVCLGMPGSLPVLNKKAFEYALRTAVALNCEVNRETFFERKNYYYPDLPKNYQISQLRKNLGEGGYLEIVLKDGSRKKVRMHNIHLEEDAGKNVHPEMMGAEEYSLVDLNRAGTPLLEIVSEPDIRTAEEAEAYMRALKNLLQYIEVSDCNMHEGRLRFELNISHRPKGDKNLPSFRSEIKNLGSIKTVLKCIEHEYKRQTRALKKGQPLSQDTRLWDEAKGRTESMRSKEEAHDYRYFPEPDLVDIEVDDAWLESIKASLPELPDAKLSRFISQYQLPEYDAVILTASRPLADYYEEAVSAHSNTKAISNWIMTDLLRELSDRELEPSESPISPRHLAEMVQLIDDGKISGKIAKKVFAEMLESGKAPGAIVEEKGLVQVKDTGQLENWVDEAIAANPGPADDFRNGKDKAIGFLVGQIMKASRGKANPQMINDMLRNKLRGE